MLPVAGYPCTGTTHRCQLYAMLRFKLYPTLLFLGMLRFYSSVVYGCLKGNLYDGARVLITLLEENCSLLSSFYVLVSLTLEQITHNIFAPQ
jgi:hypothetical protein